MAESCEKQAKLSDEIEIDESYFGAKRVRGKRGRDVSGKTPVFALLRALHSQETCRFVATASLVLGYLNAKIVSIHRLSKIAQQMNFYRYCVKIFKT